GLKPGFCGGPVRYHIDDQHARLLGEAKLAGRRRRQRLAADPEPWVLDGNPLLERWQHGLGPVDRNGETDADVAFDRALDWIVDADQLALAIEQRATGVAGVDGRVGLDHAGQGPVVRGSGTAIQPGDDAGGEG